MKRIYNILFIIMISVLVLPLWVSAEEKIYADTKYVIERKDAKEFVCEEIKEHDLEIMLYADFELQIFDKTENKTYFVDITNPGICKDKSQILQMRDIEIVIWGENNEIYKQAYDSELFNGMFYSEQLGYDVAFKQATGEYDPNQDYYIITGDSTGVKAILINPSNETDFNNGNYNVILEPKSKTLLGKMDPSNLVASKEKIGLTQDLVFEKDGLLAVLEFNNKKHYIFHDKNVQQYLGIFDENGNYQTFEKEKLLLNNFSVSQNQNYVILYKEENGKQVAEVLDKSYNTILTKQIEDYIVHFFGEKDNVTYIVENNLSTYEIKINSITKTKVETELNPNTYDGITTSIIIGIIALLGLIIVGINYKKSN